MRKQNGSIDQEKVDTSNETEEPEEPDECEKLGSGNSLEIFLRRALNATNGKLYIYKVCNGRSIRGKSVEDFVQDSFVAYLTSKKILYIDINDISTLQKIVKHVSDALKKALNSKEVRLIKNSFADHWEYPTPPQQRRIADNEINKKWAMLFDKFYSQLPSNKKRAVDAITDADIPEMLKLFTSKYKKILRCLVKFGYLNEDYTRMKMSFNLHRPVQIQAKLPEEFGALSNKIFHILKGDKLAKKWYLAGKLKISYQEAKILYNNLGNELRDLVTEEFENGILSDLSELDKMEIFGKIA